MNGVLFNNYLHKTRGIQIQLMVIDIQLNSRLLKSSILGHMAWVGLNSRDDKDPNSTSDTWVQRHGDLWAHLPNLLTTEQPGKCMCQFHSPHRGIWWQNINYHLLIWETEDWISRRSPWSCSCTIQIECWRKTPSLLTMDKGEEMTAGVGEPNLNVNIKCSELKSWIWHNMQPPRHPKKSYCYKQ